MQVITATAFIKRKWEHRRGRKGQNRDEKGGNDLEMNKGRKKGKKKKLPQVVRGKMDRMRKIGGEEEQGRQIQEIEGREETFSF